MGYINLRKSKIILVVYNELRKVLTMISPMLNTLITFRLSKGYFMNFKKPRTFDEKVSWLKLNYYNNNNLVSMCTDKFLVRKYVESKGLKNILNELLHIYENEEQIIWSELPSKFALKWNMGCGSNIICFNKEELDINQAMSNLKKWRKTKYYLPNSELQYKKIKPLLICEKIIESSNGKLPVDYKFYSFNGKAEMVMVCIDRDSKHPKFYFFNRDWELLRINKDGMTAEYDFKIAKPSSLDNMFDIADILSEPFPFVRVDLYECDEKVIFGELTFTPAGGIDSNMPKSLDLLLGDLLIIK